VWAWCPLSIVGHPHNTITVTARLNFDPRPRSGVRWRPSTLSRSSVMGAPECGRSADQERCQDRCRRNDLGRPARWNLSLTKSVQDYCWRMFYAPLFQPRRNHAHLVHVNQDRNPRLERRETKCRQNPTLELSTLGNTAIRSPLQETPTPQPS
jgi:hypothetical protein